MNPSHPFKKDSLLGELEEQSGTRQTCLSQASLACISQVLRLSVLSMRMNGAPYKAPTSQPGRR
jgi:hypothetical protein